MHKHKDTCTDRKQQRLELRDKVRTNSRHDMTSKISPHSMLKQCAYRAIVRVVLRLKRGAWMEVPFPTHSKTKNKRAKVTTRIKQCVCTKVRIM